MIRASVQPRQKLRLGTSWAMSAIRPNTASEWGPILMPTKTLRTNETIPLAGGACQISASSVRSARVLRYQADCLAPLQLLGKACRELHRDMWCASSRSRGRIGDRLASTCGEACALPAGQSVDHCCGTDFGRLSVHSGGAPNLSATIPVRPRPRPNVSQAAYFGLPPSADFMRWPEGNAICSP